MTDFNSRNVYHRYNKIYSVLESTMYNVHCTYKSRISQFCLLTQLDLRHIKFQMERLNGTHCCGGANGTFQY